MDNTYDRLNLVIREKGITTRALAEETGISKSAMQRYVTGETRKIPIERLMAISKALGVSVAYIMGCTKSDMNNAEYVNDTDAPQSINKCEATPESMRLAEKIDLLSEESRRELEKYIDYLISRAHQ